ncbi:4-coumarate--CoA ligase 1-like isoform X1 [Colletes gigas]|uniref:4-coumarate--CoA ligase 1-like isoform X1 n=2 Tax=Colletes gigas TaxID=935657 RepID=UPI001C9B4917|nr:4-coumarate--CoA ligase 1-like isoform X1 [Colletes gigas]
MVAGNTQQNGDLPFIIENNVLKGKIVPCVINYTNVGKAMFDVMQKHPDFVGQLETFTGVEETFGEMLDRAIKCALWMQKQGIGKGDVVAVSTHNHRDSFTPCLAALFIGAAFNPWDYEMNTHLARHFMTLTKPKIIFANEQSVGVTLEASKIEVFHTKVVTFGNYPGTTSFADLMKGHSKSTVENFQCVEIDNLGETAVILYSSGTTGMPKGTQLPHRALLNVLLSEGSLKIHSQRPMWFSSLYWVSGTLLSCVSITCVTKKIIPPDFDEKTACEMIEKYKVEWLLLSTSMANRVIRFHDLQNYDLSSIKVILVGGSVLKQESQDVLRKHLQHATVLQAYGMTELGGLVSAQMVNSTSGSCGVVKSNCEIKIIDPDTGKILGPNETGELCAKTPLMMTGYYRNPEATKNIIDQDGWLHSGDLAYYNEGGELFIVDRLKEIIKFRGHQIAPTEIEDLLQSHPGVLEAAVVSIPHPVDDEHPVAFVSKVPNKEVTAQELINKVATTLMDHCKLRGGVKFLPSLPHTHSGKVSRKELKAMAKSLVV